MSADAIANLSLVPPLAFRLTALFMFAASGFFIALHSLIVAASAQRAGLEPRTRLRAPLAVAAALAIWFGLALIVADDAHFPLSPDVSRLGLTVAALLAPIVLGIVALFSSRTLRTINAATPSQWLILPQAYRVAGVMFLYPFLYYGVLPGGFAWPAGLGDMLVGALAPFVARAVARGTPRARTLAILWNVFGLVDLIVAPVSALWAGAAVAIIYPLALAPLFVGPPLAILLHVLSLRNLLVTRPLSRAAQHGQFTTAHVSG